MQYDLRCEEVWQAFCQSANRTSLGSSQTINRIRASGGTRKHSDDYYLALPYRDLSGRNSWQWAIRARTFRYIERKILPGIITLATLHCVSSTSVRVMDG